ncbi:MAG: hypothetical protein IKW30_10510 [Lachnospiraceae bacterium]|nr:hypothetical protein [Lachnospiraceae bacterium]
MTGLLEIRESLKTFYARNEIYLNPCVKFMIALISLIVVNGSMGYMTLLKNPVVVLVIALMCSFMPKNFIVIVAAFWVLLHSYSLAMECAVVVAAVFVIMFLLYFRYTPKHTMVVLLTPLMFAVKIPYAMPVVLGLLGTPLAGASLSCGVVVYYIIKLMSDNVTVFSAMDAESGSQKFRIMLDGILDNKGMFVTLIVFLLTLILVYTIRRMSIDNAWTVAIIAGLTTNAVLLLVCEFVLELQFSVIAIALGTFISFGICILVQFLEFNVDYTRTEIVQFEDDEYYYYVKAVPKNIIAAPEKKVKRINKQHKKVPAKQEKQVTTIKTSHGVSRTTVKQDQNKKNRTKQD